MKKWLVILALLLFSLSGIAAADAYILRPGDALDINVLGFDELNNKSPDGLVISPDGTISFPFVGEFVVRGMTVSQLQQYLTEQLGKYYNNPIVTVNIQKYSTVRVYVLGQVNKPGLYELDRSCSLIDAISQAGGWTKDAAKKKIHIIHIDQKSAPEKINLLSLLEKGDTSQNPNLKEGDIVYLSDNGRINVTQDVLPYISTAYDLRYYWNYNR